MDLNKKLTILDFWKKILGLSSDVRQTLYLYVLFVSLNKLMSICIAYFVSTAIMENNNNNVIFLSLFFLLFKLLEWLFFVVKDFYFVKSRSLTIENLSKNIFRKILFLQNNISDGISTVELLRKTDVRNLIRNFIGFSINHFATLMIDLILSVSFLIYLAGTNLNYIVYIFIITVATIMFLGGFIKDKFLIQRNQNPLEEIQKNENNLIATTKDLFSKIYIAKAYNSESLFINTRKEFSEKERILMTNYRQTGVKWFFSMFAISSISFSIIFYITIIKLNSGEIDKGTFSAIMVLLTGLFWKLQQITYIFEDMSGYNESMSFAFNILEYNIKEKVKNNNNIIENNLEINNLCFSYGKKEILKNISLKLKNNESLFLVGTSGAGKSTLINLILGEESKYSGQILWNNVPINEQNNIIALIPQETIIKDGSLDFNLSIGKEDASEEEKIDALKQANIFERINKTGGLNQMLNKSNLSGGEMQRIAIARAYLSKRPFFLLDEPTSALDINLEKEFFNELMNIKNKIKLIVTHRVLAIPNNSKIAVLKNGEIVELGILEELINDKNSCFYKLYEDAKYESN